MDLWQRQPMEILDTYKHFFTKVCANIYLVIEISKAYFNSGLFIWRSTDFLFFWSPTKTLLLAILR